MIIKKFTGSTEVEAITKAKDELGSEAIVMNVKTIKPRGIFRLFKPVTVEITAALEENDIKPQPKPDKKTDGFVAVADEEIKIDPIDNKTNEHKEEKIEPKRESKSDDSEGLEERLNNLQHFIEEQLSNVKEEKKEEKELDENSKEISPEKRTTLQFIKMLYNIMIENEIDEKYANQIIEEIERSMGDDSHIDYILSSVYQKMILKFGKSKVIEVSENKPKVVFFIGPTGVGKTTTIAKLASVYNIDKKKSVALVTSDTYRIAATEQLRTYADILNTPLSVVYSESELIESIEQYNSYDLVFVDTAGHSHKNSEQQEELKKILNAVKEKFECEVFLVLSATTKYKDLKNVADAYTEITDYSIIFTKLDETSTFGNILNLKLYTGAQIAYTTNGQNVPDDMEIFNSQNLVKYLLGGKS